MNTKNEDKYIKVDFEGKTHKLIVSKTIMEHFFHTLNITKMDDATQTDFLIDQATDVIRSKQLDKLNEQLIKMSRVVIKRNLQTFKDVNSACADINDQLCVLFGLSDYKKQVVLQ